jgi:hypothetical protein
MATPDPYWTDGHGNLLPKNPCPKCGANVGPMPLRVEHLRNLGWQPYEVQRYQWGWNGRPSGMRINLAGFSRTACYPRRGCSGDGLPGRLAVSGAHVLGHEAEPTDLRKPNP